MNRTESRNNEPDQPSSEQLMEEFPTPAVLPTAGVDVAAATHTGYVKNNNEDHYLVMRFGRSLENLSSNLRRGLLARSYDVTGYAMFVADGMGGHAGGEIASRMSLTRLVELLVETPDWMLSLEKPEYAAIVIQRIKDRFFQIDESLRAEAERVNTLRGMGTTLTVAGTLGRELVLGHIGDSRAYLLRAGKFEQLTTDHTLAQALIDAGVAKPDDPATHSMRHVLTAALGSLGDAIQPQIHRTQISVGDQLLLCTDGLTEMVDDEEISYVITEAESAQSACHDLVDLALRAGGLDNVTVVLARFGAELADASTLNLEAHSASNLHQ
jgi:PPM family protein phosphatase